MLYPLQSYQSYGRSSFCSHCFVQADVDSLDIVDLYIENRTKQDQIDEWRVQTAVVMRADATHTPVVKDDKQRFPSELLRHL